MGIALVAVAIRVEVMIDLLEVLKMIEGVNML